MNKNEVLDAFKLYDLNGDGIIDLQEYLQGCKKHLMNHHQTSDEDLTKAFFIFDQNGDGSIDEQEFFAAMAYLGITKSFVKIDKEEIHAGFKSYDVDGDGKISLSEYVDGCRRNGCSSSEKNIQKAFQLFDLDDDQYIDQQEYYWATVYLASIVEES